MDDSAASTGIWTHHAGRCIEAGASVRGRGGGEVRRCGDPGFVITAGVWGTRRDQITSFENATVVEITISHQHGFSLHVQRSYDCPDSLGRVVHPRQQFRQPVAGRTGALS